MVLSLAGVGEAMGGMFDVNHPLLGASLGIGVPSFAISAILLTIAARQFGILIPIWTAIMPIPHALLMAFLMFSFTSSLKSHGIKISNQLNDLALLPEDMNRGMVGRTEY